MKKLDKICVINYEPAQIERVFLLKNFNFFILKLNFFVFLELITQKIMKVIDFIYQGQHVQFSDNGNLMVNATQMANIFGADVPDYLENKSTEKFIQNGLATEKSELISKK